MDNKEQLLMLYIMIMIDVGISETLKMTAGLMVTQGDQYDNEDIVTLMEIAKKYESSDTPAFLDVQNESGSRRFATEQRKSLTQSG